MATVNMEKVNKVYENGFHAVKDMDMDLHDGEFMVLVGPSGCGKTTALRMVAGLEDITSGVLRIGGKVVNDQTPKERDIAMVFQNYALYPHMTVAENIGFALKLRHMPKDQLRAKVTEVAKTLDLTDWLDRKPGQLSGGQRQRVAMGRAIVRQPSVFLMDEPLSNLDAKLRVQMRAEVARIQRRLAVTTIYVTHDQVEAMTMGDRVTVMREGTRQQVGTPQDLYDNPDNVFVAAFIGSPAMNLYDAVVGDDVRSIKLGSQGVDLPDTVTIKRPALCSYAGKDVIMGMRPENLRAAPPDYTGPALIGDVNLVEALGSELVVHFTIDANRVLAEGAVDKDESAAFGHGEGVARVDPKTPVKAGDKMPFAVDIQDMYFFDTETELAIRDLPRSAAPPPGPRPSSVSEKKSHRLFGKIKFFLSDDRGATCQGTRETPWPTVTPNATSPSYVSLKPKPGNFWRAWTNWIKSNRPGCGRSLPEKMTAMKHSYAIGARARTSFSAGCLRRGSSSSGNISSALATPNIRAAITHDKALSAIFRFLPPRPRPSAHDTPDDIRRFVTVVSRHEPFMTFGSYRAEG